MHVTDNANRTELHRKGETVLLSIIQAAGWPIWTLIVCSVVGLALIIERAVSLRATKVAPPTLLDEAIQASRAGVPPPAVVEQLAENSLLGAVLASGFRALHANPGVTEAELRAQLESAGRLAAARLQRYLGALATVASAAPLLGLLGTVIGMIEIFGSQAGPGGLLPGGGNPAQLAHGISVALYNTAFGLIIAIPALIFWRYYRARADALLLQMEVAAERFVHHLLTLRR
ncbi:tolQ: protein TolQ [Tepidimonas taiwanensis]|uniref:TolQ: protein TolQ n=1 Tax=Tepidimonas taiwanensis TaxID=307486 RepID=A0A554XBC3_9BURK|nr:tolQ: protein TolQ [Tepidimonas taiwanensis]